MRLHAWSLALMLLSGPVLAAGWTLPPDAGHVEPDAIASILGGDDYPVTSGYRTKTE
ncbi:MAG: hypothetical protein H7322_08240, partial [Ramlibacter sp.]|nr:hypothetical protein [Ramlibacter sp.]